MAESRNVRAKRSTTRFIEISTSRFYYRCYTDRSTWGSSLSPSLPPHASACARTKFWENESEGERGKGRDSRWSGGRV